MQVSAINFQQNIEESRASSWIPSKKNLAWGAAALSTILAVGTLWYFIAANDTSIQETPKLQTDIPPINPKSASFSYTEIFPINSQCASSSYIAGLSKNVADICSQSSPFRVMCNGNLGYTRPEMPQVVGNVLQEYLSEKAFQNISMVEESIDPAILTPAQSEMSPNNIASMMAAWMEGVWDPCKERILAANGYVIDGHHRWAACTLLNRPMTILNIHESAKIILSELSTFRGVFSLGLGQSV